MEAPESPSIVEPDRVPPYTWSPEWGERVFWYDAFISHNRRDGSAGFHKQLGAGGVRAWHDGDASLQDRKVQLRIALALMHSRYVVVYVGLGFQNSIWCKAEYLPALDAARLAGAQRVLVAMAGADSPVPAELAGCPRFRLDAGEAQNLCAFLKQGNRLQFDPAQVLDVAQRPAWSVPEPSPDREWEGVSKTIDVGGEDISARLRSSLDSLLEIARGRDGDSNEGGGQLLMAVRSLLENVPDNAALPDPLLALYRRVAHVFADASEKDDRANALMIFERLADLRPGAQANRDVIEFLRRESHEGLIGTTRAWLGKDPGRWSEDERCVLQLAVLRGSNYFRKPETASLVATFPEAVRIRVQIPAGPPHAGEVLQSHHFPAEETLLLLEERLGHILAKDIEPFETELFLVDLHGASAALLLDESPPAKGAILARLVDMYARIVPFSVQNGGRPLIDMGLSAYQWLLLPLTRLAVHPEIRTKAFDICRGVCDVLDRYGPYEADKAHSRTFRQHLDRLEEGTDSAASEIQLLAEIARNDMPHSGR